MSGRKARPVYADSVTDDPKDLREGRRFATAAECVERIQRVGRYVQDEVMPLIADIEGSAARSILLAFLARGTTTYNAIGLLGENEFGEQAAMINRSLFEQMVDAHWFADNQEAGVKLLGQHERWTVGGFAEAAKRHPEMFPAPSEGVDVPDSAELAELHKQFSDAGLSWTGKRLKKRIADIRGMWREDDDSLERFQDVPNRLDNLWLHPSAFALRAAFEIQEDGTVGITYGRDPTFVPHATFSATWSYGQLVTVVLQHAGFPDDTSERFERKCWGPAFASFVHLAPGEEKDVGRNEPCPCGSGLKHKRCHGA
jgi:hypothetical protein